MLRCFLCNRIQKVEDDFKDGKSTEVSCYVVADFGTSYELKNVLCKVMKIKIVLFCKCSSSSENIFFLNCRNS